MRAILLVSFGFFFGCSMAHGREDVDPVLPVSDASPLADAGPVPASDSGPTAHDSRTAGCDTVERRLRDADGDGYGNPDDDVLVNVCDPWEDGFVNWIEGRNDCDDAAPDVHPGAAEACNGIDDNCDGIVDPACVDPLLRITLDAETPAARDLVMGSTGNEVVRIRFRAGAEDIGITSLALPVEELRNVGGIRNIQYRNLADPVRVGRIATLDADRIARLSTFGILWIPAGTEAVLAVAVDVTSYLDGAVSGDSFRFALSQALADGTLSIQGATGDGRILTGDDIVVGPGDTDETVVGNWFAMFRTSVTTALSPSSPSGMHAGAAEQVVARFTIASAANEGGYSATIWSAFVLDATLVASAPRLFRVWVDDPATGAFLGTVIAERTFAAGERLAALPPYPVPHRAPFDIPAGATRTVTVTADTQDARPGDMVRVEIGVRFGDGVVTEFPSRVSPVSGATLVY